MDKADINSNEVKPSNPFEKSNVTRKHIKMVKVNQMQIISGVNKFLSEMWHKIIYEIKKTFFGERNIPETSKFAVIASNTGPLANILCLCSQRQQKRTQILNPS